MTENSEKIIYFGTGILTVLLFYFLSTIPITAIVGLGLLAGFLMKFYLELGKDILVKELFILFALLQWILGPVITYFVHNNEMYLFWMEVDSDVYFNYVTPATIAYIVGLYLPIYRKQLTSEQLLYYIRSTISAYPNVDLLLISIGIAVTFMAYLVPLSLQFFLVLVSGCRYIGLFFMVVSNRPFKWVYITGIMSLGLADSVNAGMFHHLILWLVFIVIVFAFLFNFNNRLKLTISIIMLIFVFGLQTVKHTIRALPLEERSVEAFFSIFFEKITDTEGLFSDNNIESTTVRLNQGWIIARVMYYTPKFEPFGEGETIIKALHASFVPRFIDPNKPTSGGQENFKKYTGMRLTGGTSMDLGIIGEGYANFGVRGGIIVMFFVGLFFNFIIAQLYRSTWKHPTIVLWFPLIFLEAVKAETDLATSLNYIIKGVLTVIILFYFLRAAFNVRL